MGVAGTLLKNRRSGQTRLAWNLPGLSGPQTLEVRTEAFGDGEAIPAEYAGKRAAGRNLSPPLAWTAPPPGTAELLPVMEDVDVPMRSPFVRRGRRGRARPAARAACRGGRAGAGAREADRGLLTVRRQSGRGPAG
jgi:hypothetical protein